ncbi:addiction module toxin RelE [Kouleothrix aurantiaca]|uniref:Addiction module toxin RelE n=1 Tax=Kouleothrix aurantiaca TaxID=186479 RepID=A0A0P9DND0_9CHLR|nr:addiction module toxin RelE [Kouleothrix aurantiaca]
MCVARPFTGWACGTRVVHRATIVDGIEQHLSYEPQIETRNRKPLRSNAIADWELRLGEFRVLYTVDVQVQIVEIQRVAEKRRNAFFFRGRKEDL